MPSEQDAVNIIPTNIDMEKIADSFGDPAQIFRMLDKNSDGRITHDDLQVVLGQLGIGGYAADLLSKYIFKQLDANHNGTIDASDLMNVGSILWNLYQQKQKVAGY